MGDLYKWAKEYKEPIPSVISFPLVIMIITVIILILIVTLVLYNNAESNAEPKDVIYVNPVPSI